MKQQNQEKIKKSQELLRELAVKRGGGVLSFHKQMGNDPELLNAFSQMYDMCNKNLYELPRKYRELIIFAIACSRNAETTIKVHGKLALEHGATIDELGEVLRILFFSCGVTGFHPGLQVLEEIESEL